MSWIEKTGGSAFPTVNLDSGGASMESSDGMTLRDYFAAKLLPLIYREVLSKGVAYGFEMDWRKGVAIAAYAMADEMLKARKV